MSATPSEPECNGCSPDNPALGSAYQIEPTGSEGVFAATEALGWDLAAPHGALVATSELVTSLFYSKGEDEAQVAEALKDVWNRILARNMAYTEGMIQLMVESGREALNHFQEAQYSMISMTALKMIEAPDVVVVDGQ